MNWVQCLLWTFIYRLIQCFVLVMALYTHTKVSAGQGAALRLCLLGWPRQDIECTLDLRRS